MTIDDRSFDHQARETLDGLLDAVEDQLGDHLDAELEGDFLTIEMDAGGKYVINKHAPNRQIWMSSPVSGASHYAWDEGRAAWVSTRDAEKTLTGVLAEELARATGETVTFD